MTQAISLTTNHRLNADYLSNAELDALGIDYTPPVYIHKLCVITGADRIKIGPHVRIDAFTHLLAAKGPITIEPYVHIGAFGYLLGTGGIVIESGCNLSQGVGLYTSNDDYSGASFSHPMIEGLDTVPFTAPIHIGKLCLFGRYSCVLPGVTLGTGVVVGAHALVKESFLMPGIYAGTPARFVKPRQDGYLEQFEKILA